VKEKDQDYAPQDCNTVPSDIERVVVTAYEKYSAELFAYAKSIIHGEDGALDAVQESFLRYFVELSYGRRVEKIQRPDVDRAAGHIHTARGFG